MKNYKINFIPNFILFATVFFAQGTLFSPYEGWMANPVAKILNFESALKFDSYEILDASGKVLSQNMISQKQVNVTQPPNGVYFLKLFSDD